MCLSSLCDFNDNRMEALDSGVFIVTRNLKSLQYLILKKSQDQRIKATPFFSFFFFFTSPVP